jgi:hypothetical protein
MLVICVTQARPTCTGSPVTNIALHPAGFVAESQTYDASMILISTQLHLDLVLGEQAAGSFTPGERVGNLCLCPGDACTSQMTAEFLDDDHTNSSACAEILEARNPVRSSRNQPKGLPSIVAQYIESSR